MLFFTKKTEENMDSGKSSCPQPKYWPIFDYRTADNSRWCKKFRMNVHGIPVMEMNNESLRGQDLANQKISFAHFDPPSGQHYYVVFMFGKEIGTVTDQKEIDILDLCIIDKVYAKYENGRISLLVHVNRHQG